MEEQEKNQKKSLSEEQWRKAIQRMMDRTRATDFDEWETPLRADIVEALHKILKEQNGSKGG